MREIRPSGSEGGVALTTPFLPLSRTCAYLEGRPLRRPVSAPFEIRIGSNPHISHFSGGRRVFDFSLPMRA